MVRLAEAETLGLKLTDRKDLREGRKLRRERVE